MEIELCIDQLQLSRDFDCLANSRRKFHFHFEISSFSPCSLCVEKTFLQSRFAWKSRLESTNVQKGPTAIQSQDKIPGLKIKSDTKKVHFYSKCSQNAAKSHSKCSQNAVKMQPKCSQNAAKMWSKCSQNAVKMQSKFSQYSVEIQSKFSQNAVEMQSKCSQNAAKIQSKFN